MRFAKQKRVLREPIQSTKEMTMFVLYMSDTLGFGYGKKLENALYDLIFQNGFLM